MRIMDKTISIIVPCYNEQEALSLFYKELVEILIKWIIFMNLF